MVAAATGTMTPPELAATIAGLAPPTTLPGVLRVGIDGVDGAGKTTLADRLATLLSGLGRDVIRSSVDGFHQPRALRYRQGRTSARGFFEDSYDYRLLRARLLDPLSPGGNGRYRPVAFDHRTDSAIQVIPRQAPAGAVLLFDGIFLHRDELRDYWDFSVFLRVGFDETFRRMAARDGCPADPADPKNRRYLDGQRHYLATCAPETRATLVIDPGPL
jgi:uridine kinase